MYRAYFSCPLVCGLNQVKLTELPYYWLRSFGIIDKAGIQVHCIRFVVQQLTR